MRRWRPVDAVLNRYSGTGALEAMLFQAADGKSLTVWLI